MWWCWGKGTSVICWRITRPTTTGCARTLRSTRMLRSIDLRRQSGLSHQSLGSAVSIGTTFGWHNRYTQLFAHDAASGLRALIAIHDTTLGPAFGGCRMYPYASEHQAMADVLRLSRGMTYKAAICELPYGGGKSLIIADPRRDKTSALLHAMGRL